MTRPRPVACLFPLWMFLSCETRRAPCISSDFLLGPESLWPCSSIKQCIAFISVGSRELPKAPPEGLPWSRRLLRGPQRFSVDRSAGANEHLEAPWGFPAPRGPRNPNGHPIARGGSPFAARSGPRKEQSFPTEGAPASPRQPIRVPPSGWATQAGPRWAADSYGAPKARGRPSNLHFLEGASQLPFAFKGSPSEHGGSKGLTGPGSPNVGPPGLKRLQDGTTKGATTETTAGAAAGRPFLSVSAGPLGRPAVGRGSACWGPPFPGKPKIGGPPEAPPMNGSVCGLQVGKFVGATCVGVWRRYALFRLMRSLQGQVGDPKGTRGASDSIGFLHVSGLRRTGKPLPPAELADSDLTLLLPLGAPCKVEILGPPSAATSFRYQLLLHLPSSPHGGPAPQGAPRPPLLGRPPINSERLQQRGLVMGEGPPPSVLNTSGPNVELWGGAFDSELLPDEEEETFARGPRGAPKGFNGNHRRRVGPGGSDEESFKKRQRPRGGGHGGRGMLGGRRSGRDRDDEETEGPPDAFLDSEAPEEDPLLEDEACLAATVRSFDSSVGATTPPEHPDIRVSLTRPTEGLSSKPAVAALLTPAKCNAKPACQRLDTARSRASGAPKPVKSPRAAVVAVLGHVDHGKTTLLKALRLMGAKLTPRGAVKGKKQIQEAGGITQRIGVFEVSLPDGVAASAHSLTFLDTPGHGAFSCMRLRAARAADVVLLVVAANEGVQEETRRCLQVCKELNLPVVVVLTKTDLMCSSKGPRRGPLAGADFLSTVDGAKTLGNLAAEGLITEPLGGSVQVAAVNAKGFLQSQEKQQKGEHGYDEHGMQHLLECIAVQAEDLGLQANADAPGKGVVLETKCSANNGASASIILKEGTLKVGDWLVAGSSVCRVRRLRRGDVTTEQGTSTSPPGASDVVEVFGFSADSLPMLGQEATVVNSNGEAKRLQENFVKLKDDKDAAAAVAEARSRGLARLQAAPNEEAVLPIVIRADAQGAGAAVAAALEGLTAQRDSMGPWRLCHPGRTRMTKEFQPNQGAPHGPQPDVAAFDAMTTQADTPTKGNASGSSSSGDTAGTAEPFIRRVRVLRVAAGQCSAQDVQSCLDEKMRGGLLIAFATKVSKKVKRTAVEMHVQLLQCDVIYEAIEAVERRLVAPLFFLMPSRDAASTDTPGGPFTRASGGTVAGCDVISGRLRRGGLVRVLRRNGECAKEAVSVVSLRVGKESRESVAAPVECGVICEDFKDWQIGDVLVAEDY